jgi:hypothetical protein
MRSIAHGWHSGRPSAMLNTDLFLHRKIAQNILDAVRGQ